MNGYFVRITYTEIREMNRYKKRKGCEQMSTEMEKKLHTFLEKLYAASGYKDNSTGYADNAIQFMNGNCTELCCNIDVRMIKGGTYKIKDYYLEDNELVDIRGASSIITEVQEKIVPDLLWQIVGFDCVIYKGGGNMLAVIPAENSPKDIGELLEQAADRCMLTANIAYVCSEPFPLSELLGAEYKSCVSNIEQLLTERKKSRAICDLKPISEMSGELLCDVELRLPEINSTQLFCSRCCKRIASYQIGREQMCGGCAHKYLVGSEHKKRFVSDYQTMLRKERYNFADSVRSPRKYEDIDEDHIAVVYADGNNMGGLIQKITKIMDMMDFSEFVKKTMPELVFHAMARCKVLCFEIVAVGGDDIFILLPADKAISFSYELIRMYKEAYDEHFTGNQSTLSVGVCIAKPSEKIKVMLETAEEKLKDAKKLMKQEKFTGESGSLSFAVMDSYEGVSAEYGKRSMLPYSYEQLIPVLKFVKDLQSKEMKTRIRNIAEAYANAESSAEMSLFFRYINAKESKAEKRITMPEVPGYILHDGYYEKDSDDVAFWEDIIDLMNYYDSSILGEVG